MEKKIKCPSCVEGKMSIKMEVMEDNGSFTSSPTTEIDCVICDGEGTIDQDTQDMIDYEKTIWCKCGNPSKNTHYWEDGQGELVYKHHWTCADCRKVVQIG